MRLFSYAETYIRIHTYIPNTVYSSINLELCTLHPHLHHPSRLTNWYMVANELLLFCCFETLILWISYQISLWFVFQQQLSHGYLKIAVTLWVKWDDKMIIVEYQIIKPIKILNKVTLTYRWLVSICSSWFYVRFLKLQAQKITYCSLIIQKV